MTAELRNDRIFTVHTSTLTPPQYTTWTLHAACAGLPVEMFFPEGQGAAVDAGLKKLCAGCPVVADCLEMAVADTSIEGFWAGTTTRQRMTIRNRRGRRTYQGRDRLPCGTAAAYRRHLRNDEKPCGPCTNANRDYRNGEGRTA